MDVAYDHIQESALSPEEEAQSGAKKAEPSTLNKDFQDAYKAISSSPWGARLGGFFGSVVKQGEHVYKEASQELSEIGDEASRGFSNATKGFIDLRSSIINRTRSLSQTQSSATVDEKTTASEAADGEKKDSGTEQTAQEADSMLTTLRSEAAKRLKEIQKAEDAADEALLKFGTNIRNFLRDAVSIAPPTEGSGEQGSTVLFESKDSQGKRVIHTTRFDAQLHVIHSSLDSFTKDPVSEEYEPWTKEFNAEKKTDDIGKDLEKYDELRSAMEKLVPHDVAYVDFWKRYYFLRHSIETADARRRDLLKGAAASAEEEVGWDEESDDEGSGKTETEVKTKVTPPRPSSVESSTTINPHSVQADAALLTSSEPRKSNDEKSQADSDASYDVVGATSGAPSHAPGSPKEGRKGEDSEEEDWE